MQVKLYLDTSVLGALCDPGPEERVAATRWVIEGLVDGRWDGFISTLVLEEVERAPESVRQKIASELSKIPLSVLEESSESLSLAGAYLLGGAIPAKYEDDARHIAIAAINDIRIIVSWNFRHMVNIESKRRINSVNLRENLPMLDLVSPWEVL